jgi:succinate CoA transferase
MSTVANPYAILNPEEAAAHIEDGQTIGFSGFTPAGAAKIIPRAMAKRAEELHGKGKPFQVGVVTGASTGQSLDGTLAEADAISWRTPYQSNKSLRKSINEGRTRFFDMHLSMLPQAVRYGFLGHFDWAIVEAVDVTADGKIIPSTSVGASPAFCQAADKILVEINEFHPQGLRGFHDIYEPDNPPHRKPIPITSCSERIGSEAIEVDPKKIVGVVMNNEADEVAAFTPADEITNRIGFNTAEFLASEIKAGKIPKEFLPIQSGVGNVANAVLGALGQHPDIPAFEMFTEVIQDSVIELILKENIKFATGTSLTVAPDVLKTIYDDLEGFREKLLLRPQEITNSPELVRRLGIITINTAIEVDIFGNVNSTHVMGKSLMNGIGGSGDFTRNGFISIFTCPSLAKGGKISPIVPLVSHMDHSEHSVQVIITEQGIADLRGKSPNQRARVIVDNCAHPDFRDELHGYFDEIKDGHTPSTLSASFAMHEQFLKSGDMRGVDWDEYFKR